MFNINNFFNYLNNFFHIINFAGFQEDINALRASFGESNAKSDAAALLGRKPMSRADLTKKLREKGASQRESEYAAEWLEAIGALDDQTFAALLVRHYSDKGYGPARWREELHRHGIDRELWDEALESAPLRRRSLVIFSAAAGRVSSLTKKN